MAYDSRMSPLYPPPGPQSIGRVLDTAFRIFKASAVRCLVLGPLAIICGQAPNIYHLAMGQARASFGGNDPVWWGLYVLGALASMTFTSALIMHQHDIVAGVPTRAIDKLKKAIRGLPALVGMAILILLVGGALPGMLMLAAWYTEFNMALVIWRLAMIVAVVLSIYLLIGLSLTWCALLIDRVSGPNALRYSLSLVRGNWWRTVLILLITMVVMFVFYFVIIAVLAPLVGAMEVALVAAVTEVLAVALSALVAPYFSGTLLAIYGDLKARREGADLERRISAVARS
jgi:hypothetical protein